MDRIPLSDEMKQQLGPSADAPNGRTVTGHAIGGTYVSAYWRNTYKVLGHANDDMCLPNGVKVEQISGGPAGAAHSTPGDVWTHSTQLDPRDKLLKIEILAPELSPVDAQGQAPRASRDARGPIR